MLSGGMDTCLADVDEMRDSRAKIDIRLDWDNRLVIQQYPTRKVSGEMHVHNHRSENC